MSQWCKCKETFQNNFPNACKFLMTVFYAVLQNTLKEHQRIRTFARFSEVSLTTCTVGNLGISESSLGILKKFQCRLDPPNTKYNCTVLFWDKFILYLLILPNIFFMDHHCNTSIIIFWYCHICQNSLMFLYGAEAVEGRNDRDGREVYCTLVAKVFQLQWA